MDLLTHVLVSLAAARATQKWLPRFGVGTVLVAGVAPDLDSVSYWAGAEAYLRFHRGALHGIFGALVTALAVAGGAFAASKKFPEKSPTTKLNFKAALGAAVLGIALHELLDFFSGPGVVFLWPWRMRWSGVELVRGLDPWLLALLVIGIFLPELFRLVTEEIRQKREARRGSVGAIVTLVLVAGFFGLRADMRSQALGILLSSEYHHRPPVAAGVFPTTGDPFVWRGVVSTDSTIEETPVSALDPQDFDADRAVAHFKPPDSPALDVSRHAKSASLFLAYARFPLARVEESSSGTHVIFRDMRFSVADATADNLIAVVELDTEQAIRAQGIEYASR